MKHKQILARALSLLIFSLAIGVYIARDVVRNHAMGKAAYLGYHSNFFDKHLSATPQFFTKIIAYTVFIGLLMAVYELLAYGVARICSALWPTFSQDSYQETRPVQ